MFDISFGPNKFYGNIKRENVYDKNKCRRFRIT